MASWPNLAWFAIGFVMGIACTVGLALWVIWVMKYEEKDAQEEDYERRVREIYSPKDEPDK